MFRVLRAALVGALILASAAVTSVFADATPVQLVLVYMPNVSNTGTQAASGIAELVMLEGEVRIKTANLPRLDDARQYVAWVVNTETNQFQRLGAFNTAASTGAVDFQTVLPDEIPNKHWNLLLLTVEDSADAARPSSHHSIAGVFPSADNAPLPLALPNTGGDENSEIRNQTSDGVWANWRLTSVLGALVLTVTFGAGYAVGHRRVARR